MPTKKKLLTEAVDELKEKRIFKRFVMEEGLRGTNEKKKVFP